MQLGIILVWTAIATVQRCAWATCPPPYVDLETGCYHFTVREGLTWDQAYFTCQIEFSGYLAEIDTEEEQSNVTAHIIDLVDPTLRNVFWLGATDILQTGTFRWMTSGNTMAYSAWKSGEPNDYAGHENCVLFMHDQLWYDFDCERNDTNAGRFAKAICEINPLIEGR